MKPNNPNQRREFLKKGILATGGITVIPPHVMFAGRSKGSFAPSDKVNLACVGIGHRGGR